MGEVRRAWTLLASAALLALALVGALLVTPSSAASGEAASVPLGCSAAVLPGQARCFTTIHRPPSSVGGIRSYVSSIPDVPRGLSPANVATLYNLPGSSGAGAGTGPTVALVEAWDTPDLEAELGAYRRQFGLGSCSVADRCLTILNQHGKLAPLPTAGPDWAWETMMDVEAVAAACPACKVLVVEAADNDSQNLGEALAVAASRADYVSMSWGFPDDGMSADGAAAFEKIFALHPDVTFVASTGDFGWSTYIPSPDGNPEHTLSCGTEALQAAGDTHSCTNYPASSPHVVAAGGTVALQSSDGTWTQQMWGAADDDGYPNSGGVSSGCSGWTTMPAAQAGNLNARTACGDTRGTADIAALADGFSMYHAAQDEAGDASPGDIRHWWVGGGTSLAAPLLAAMYARAGNHTSPFDIYKRANAQPSAFTDVTTGVATRGCPASDPTHLCSAGAGWDGPTGLGAPYGLTGLAALDSSVPPTPKPTPTKTPALQRVHHSGKVKVKGKARVRAKLKASYGVFEAGSTVTVTWLIKKKAVARGIKVRVRKAWLRRKLRYVVTATAAGRTPLSLTSPAVKVKR